MKIYFCKNSKPAIHSAGLCVQDLFLEVMDALPTIVRPSPVAVAWILTCCVAGESPLPLECGGKTATLGLRYYILL